MSRKLDAETFDRQAVADHGRTGAGSACVAEIGDAVPGAPIGSRRAGREASAGPRFCSAVCFHAWHQQRHDDVVRELSELTGGARSECTVGGDAAQIARDWLTCRGGPQHVTELALRNFLWYQLPLTTGPLSEHLRVAAVLGRLLQAVDLPRYARLCTSSATAEVLGTYHARGIRAGRSVYQRALDRSGIVPPDVPELAWGTRMGIAEVDAYEATAAMLELAVTAGALKPGTAGWRIRQMELTSEYLTAPAAELGGACRLERIRAERVDAWARSRGSARRTLTVGLLPRLRQPLPPPSDAVEHLAPLQWLLRRAGTEAGLPLTGTHHFTPAVVVEAQEWFGLDAARPDRDGATTDGVCLGALREMLHAMRAVRRTGRRLVLTRHGRELLADPARLWSSAVLSLIESADGLDGLDGAIAEAALLVLADGRQLGREDLVRRVTEVLDGEGWCDPATGAAPDAQQIRGGLARLWRRLCGLGMLGEERWLRPVRLTPCGQVAAAAAMSAHAVRPGHTVRSR